MKKILKQNEKKQSIESSKKSKKVVKFAQDIEEESEKLIDITEDSEEEVEEDEQVIQKQKQKEKSLKKQIKPQKENSKKKIQEEIIELSSSEEQEEQVEKVIQKKKKRESQVVKGEVKVKKEKEQDEQNKKRKLNKVIQDEESDLEEVEISEKEQKKQKLEKQKQKQIQKDKEKEKEREKQIEQEKQIEKEKQNSKKLQGLIDNQVLGQKKWKDKGEKTGPFSQEEKVKIMRALCQYAYNNNFNEEKLMQIMTEKYVKEIRGIWVQLAQQLPQRSPQSVHNYCKRHFSPQSYQGKWTKEEEQHFIKAVEQNGPQWVSLSKQMQRTPADLRDKYRQLGGVYYKENDKTWKIVEILNFLKYIEKVVEVQFIDREKLKEIKEKEPEFLLQSLQVKGENKNQKFKYLSRFQEFIDFEKIKTVQFNDMPWTLISEKIKTKSFTDCMNLWRYYIFSPFILQKKYSTQEDIQLIQNIIDQEVDDYTDIDFKIDNGKSAQENKFRFNVLKKQISQKKGQKLNEELQQLLQRILSIENKQKISQIFEDDEEKIDQHDMAEVGDSLNNSNQLFLNNNKKGSLNLLQFYKSNFQQI